VTPTWAPALLLAAAVSVAVGLPSARRLDPSARGSLWTPARDWGVRHTLALVVAVLLVWGPVPAAIGAGGSFAASRWWAARLHAKGRQAERDGAGEALAVLAAELRAGRPTDVACEGAAEVATGPLADALRAASGSGRFGADPAACLLAHVGSSAVPDLLRGLAACWQVCASTGSSLAAAVDRLAEGLAADQAQRLLVESELAGPRASAGLLAMLPVAGLVLAAGLGARPMQVLLHTPVGLACLAAGVALDAAGVLWTARLIAAARQAR
jgi:tight adherence protein B